MSQRISDANRTTGPLETDHSEYFGSPLSEFDNSGGWPASPADGPLTRTSYLYQAIYKRGNDYGGIQLRARVHTYGDCPDGLSDRLETVAHRAAYLFDSSTQTSAYGSQSSTHGTTQGDGYLSGFNSVELYQSRESEEVTESEAETPPLVVDWSVTIYKDESFDRASLSGIAQGLANPFDVEVSYQEGSPGRDDISIPPHKWNLSYNSARDAYQVSPPGRTSASDRYRDGAGSGKDVYVNGEPIGSMGVRARTYIRNEYTRGDPNKSRSGNFSREGLVDETAATYQALRDGGTLYLTGETETAVYLSTARALPDGYEPLDADDVPVALETQAGREPVPGREVRLLTLRSEDADMLVDCRRDERIISHLGLSTPPYSHYIGPRQTWTAELRGRPRGERS